MMHYPAVLGAVTFIPILLWMCVIAQRAET
jgi:hypothetical protein